MMFTTQMTQLIAVVLGKDREGVTEALLREGVMQFVSVSEFESQSLSKLSDPRASEPLTAITDLRKRIEGVLHTVGIVPKAPQETDLATRVDVNLDQETAKLDKLDSERDGLRERQRSLQQEVLKLEDLQRQIGLYGLGLSEKAIPSNQSLLTMQTGKMPVARAPHMADALKSLPVLNVTLGQEGDTSHHLLLFMKRDRSQMNRILADVGWIAQDLPREMLTQKKELVGDLTAKLEKLTDEQDKIQKKVDRLIKQQQDHLESVWTQLRVNELCHRIQTHFKSSMRTLVFAGWLPSEKKTVITRRITEACQGNCYLEWNEPGSQDVLGADVPVKFNNPGFLAPFQMLVANFGVPKYGTIDPTPFVMPMYLIMFGLMFADVGQGLVLMALGFLATSAWKDNPAKAGMCQMASLLIWCGGASAFFGVLFGSYFGVELFHPVWFNFHAIVAGHDSGNPMIKDVYDILAITIRFGIAVIVMGLLFNWVNLIRQREWFELVFDKGGLLGGWMYAGGIYIATYMVAQNYKGFPAGWVLFLLAGLPALILLAKEPLHIWQHRKHGPPPGEKKTGVAMLVMNGLMEWIVELLEIFSGYLSNTLSFMRVAGLGIAHVCLMISFFTLAEMTSGVMSALILILGNVLVIGLEGLSAGIQALRLNYYEFFTKFFHGTGKLHTPISLRSKL
jgi:V/A-type H+-transporting ATPase subunit I